MVFEAVYDDRARWVLDRVSPEDYAAIQACIAHLEHNPFPGASERAPLVIPGLATDPHAYRCGTWAISFRVETVFIVIEAIGRVWRSGR